MPLPFILGAIGAKMLLGAAVATGVVGAAKGVKGVIDSNEADDIFQDAENILNNAKNKIEEQRKKTLKTLKKLGEKKIEVASEELTEFVTEFSKIKNINLSEVKENLDLKNLNFNENSLREMKNISIGATSVLTGIGSGAAAGTLLAWGSYGAVSALGAASTGTAIAGLTGAAATNATLAWLGGGSLVAGGGGMALGTAVLGGLVAGPALLIAGGIFGSKAEEKLNNAHSNLSQAKKIEKELEVAGTELQMVTIVAEQMNQFLEKLRNSLYASVRRMKRLITISHDWNDYDKEEKEGIMLSLKLAQAIKLLLDTSVLDDTGKTSSSAKQIARSSGEIGLLANQRF
ncbi:MAG: hypothetical protein ACRC0Y_14965 [Fusobacteriaceae bacterium]